MSALHAVTGAFGYSGKYIAQKLLEKGDSVLTLTNSGHRADPFNGRVRVLPLAFDQPENLEQSLAGVDTLYNTYWVRFNHPKFTHEQAVRNVQALFAAARRAGVRRVVHISITNPSLETHLEYFSGKARMERALIDSGLSYAILRPTVIFGREDILINNIAWALRHLPIFGTFGDGQYKLQPIFVEDLAQLAVDWGNRDENTIINAIGPETYTYRELAQTIGRHIGAPRPVLAFPPRLAYLAGQAIGALTGDVTITWPEVEGLMANLLYVDAPPAGSTRLSEWIKQNANSLGKHYAHEIGRRVG